MPHGSGSLSPKTEKLSNPMWLWAWTTTILLPHFGEDGMTGPVGVARRLYS